MNKMNVLYIINEAALGGAAQSALDMLGVMSSYINPVVVIPTNGVIENELKKRKIIYYVEHFERGYGFEDEILPNIVKKRFIANYRCACRLKKIIEEHKIDIIHTNSSVSNVGMLASLIYKRPHVWHMRELILHEYGNEIYDDDETQKTLLELSDATISISNFVGNAISAHYGIKVCTVYNGIDTERYINEIKPFDLVSSSRTFMIAGSITEWKKQWDAVKATELLVQKGYEDVRLQLVGSKNGSLGWIIEKYVKKNGLANYVKMIPFTNDLRELRNYCLCSISSSPIEGLGRLTIEAMMAGNIVIGVASGGSKEVIGEDGKRGLLYEPGDYRNLAGQMIEVLNMSEDRRQTMRMNAQKYACRTFSLSSYSENINKIYQEVLQTYEWTEEKERFLDIIRTTALDGFEFDDAPNHPESVEADRYDEVMARISYLSNSGVRIADLLKQMDIRSVAIYGMGNMGRFLYDELNDDIEIRYVMDQKPGLLSEVVNVYSLEESLPEVDLIIVSVLSEQSKIVEQICKFGYDNVIGITDLISEKK